MYVNDGGNEACRSQHIFSVYFLFLVHMTLRMIYILKTLVKHLWQPKFITLKNLSTFILVVFKKRTLSAVNWDYKSYDPFKENIIKKPVYVHSIIKCSLCVFQCCVCFSNGIFWNDCDGRVCNIVCIKHLINLHSSWYKHLAHCCLSVCYEDAPTITTSDVKIKETFSGSLHCIVSSNPASVITWRRIDKAMDITEGLVKETNSLSLTFTDVSREDAGKYRCSANNSIGDAVYTDATLVVICKILCHKQWL